MPNNNIIIAFVAEYDNAILSIHEGYATWSDACADAQRRNAELDYQLYGYRGRYDAYMRHELDYI